MLICNGFIILKFSILICNMVNISRYNLPFDFKYSTRICFVSKPAWSLPIAKFIIKKYFYSDAKNIKHLQYGKEKQSN